MYRYGCVIVRVVDGDTVVVDIDLGFHTWLREQFVRLYGIDTPELRSRDADERVVARMARDRVVELLPPGSRAVVETELRSADKYGRILGTFYVPWHDGSDVTVDVSVNELLVRERLAVRYLGQSKAEVAEAHLGNRLVLLGSGVDASL